MKRYIPELDLPVDYVITDQIAEPDLNKFKDFSCKVRAGLFILCTKGYARIKINLSEYVVRENDFIVLIPDNFVQIYEVSLDIHLNIAGFSSGLISGINLLSSTQNLLPVIIDNPITSLTPHKVPTFEGFYKAFIRAYSITKIHQNKEIMKAILSLFIQAVYEIYRNRNKNILPSQTRKNEIYRDFMQMVMKYYRTQHGAAFYAGRLGLTLPHFCNSIKKASGHTPLEIISSTLIMDAKAQLKSTTLTVKEIALTLGFSNLSFFNKYFKQHTGLTPQHYREQ